jgi:hypothetical protein
MTWKSLFVIFLSINKKRTYLIFIGSDVAMKRLLLSHLTENEFKK